MAGDFSAAIRANSLSEQHTPVLLSTVGLSHRADSHRDCWLRRRPHAGARWNLEARAALIAASYGAVVLAAFLLLRGRSNAAVRADFADGFMPVDSLAAIWGFLGVHGRRMLESSLPRMEGSLQPWDGTFVWLMPCLGLGLIWLMVRVRTCPFGLAVVGFYLVFLAASALRVYPLGVLGGEGRTDIFALPVAICLLMAGLQCATESLPKVSWFRTAAAAAAISLALWSPHYAPYNTDMRTRALIDYVAVTEQPEDGLILSYPAGFLAAVYGSWPFRISGDRRVHNGTIAEVERPRTLRLPAVGPPSDGKTRGIVKGYLATGRPDRIWFVNYWSEDWDVVGVLEQEGYVVHDIATEARDGRLHLALDLAHDATWWRPRKTERRQVVSPIGQRRHQLQPALPARWRLGMLRVGFDVPSQLPGHARMAPRTGRAAASQSTSA